MKMKMFGLNTKLAVLVVGVWCQLLSACVVVASSGTCDDLSKLLPSAGGWKNTDPEDDSPWFKGSEFAPCTGPCLPFNSTHPYRLSGEEIPAGQTIADPENAWFTSDSYSDHWCMTGEEYSVTGGLKKFWGYCSCAKLCGDINNEANCKATFYTPNPTPCVFGSEGCVDAPDCSAANSVYGASSLRNKCGNDPACTFASGACHFTPTTCDGVNSIFGGKGAPKKASCLDNAEGCYYHKGQCLSIPETCAAVDALKDDMVASKFKKLCMYSDEGCYDYQGECRSLPLGCAGVNNDAALAEIHKDGNKFAEICGRVEGCGVYDSQCQRTPDSCNEVNGEFNTASSIASACNSVSNENCALVDGNCAEVDCEFYHTSVPSSQKRNLCLAADGCALKKGRCCDDDSQCFQHATGDECKADVACEWKGPTGKKACTCAYELDAARRL